jgi:HPt (histidine-containing phosphotransfer) domain-containing protein
VSAIAATGALVAASASASATATIARSTIVEAARTAPPASKATPGMDQNSILVLRKTRPQLFERMIAAYLKYSPDAVQKMNDAVVSGDVAALKMSSHSLKSSSANVGAMKLAGLCRQIEDLTKTTEAGAASALVAQASAEFGLVMSFLREQTQAAPSAA